jgi:phosphomethylpyrimidine synthase
MASEHSISQQPNPGAAGTDNGKPGPKVPQARAEWIRARKAQSRDGNFSQMHFARGGVITEEM